jgi:hypothetical protein
MMIRNVIDCFVFALVLSALLLAVSAAVLADDFSLRLTINGNDISEMETVEIDPDGEFIVDLRIFDNPGDITLHSLSVSVTFADISILTVTESLLDHHMEPDDIYHREIPVNSREMLKLGDANLTTGKYRTQVRLEYSAGDSPTVWSRRVNIQVVGNPLLTPVGGAGAVISAMTVGAVIWLVKGLSSLYQLAMGNLESLARGRVVGSIVNAARKRIVRDKCPVCGERFKNEYCFTCKKSAKEIRREYRDRLQDLAQQGEKLLADGKATYDELCSELGIGGQLAADVMAVIKDARMVRVQGFARGLMVKAVFAGIGMALSTIIWITVGGFAVLGTAALLAILIAAIVIPLAVTWGLRIKAKRALQRSMT